MNLPFDEKRDYTQIINKFYQTSNKLKKISYNKFYIYYMEHFAKYIFEFAHEAINMNAKEKSKKKKIHIVKILITLINLKKMF